MVKSVSRRTALSTALCVFGFFLILSTQKYFDLLPNEDRTSEYVFNAPHFLRSCLICSIPGTIMFLLIHLSSKKFIIQNDKIELKRFLRKREELLLTDICEISWGSGEGRVMQSGSMANRATSRNDRITITFNSGRKLKIAVIEYSNFDEIRTWFLNYGRKTGVIKIRSLSDRKRRAR